MNFCAAFLIEVKYYRAPGLTICVALSFFHADGFISSAFSAETFPLDEKIFFIKLVEFVNALLIGKKKTMGLY